MMIRVTGNGHPNGTRVTTETGVDITESVMAVSFRHEVGKVPTVEVDFKLADVGFPGEGKAYFNGREVARIIYADGGEEEF